MTSLPIVYGDAGHGGKDPGAVGSRHATKESEMALDVTTKVGILLLGIVDHRLTRVDDTFLELWERPAIANKNKAALFYSYHFNSGSSQATKQSFEVFTTPGQNNSDTAASMAYEEHEAEFRGIQVGRADNSDGDPDKERKLAVIRLTDSPSYLFEGEFIHTKKGEEFIRDEIMRWRMAYAQARAICRFFGIDPDKVNRVWETVAETKARTENEATSHPELSIEEKFAELQKAFDDFKKLILKKDNA